MPSRLSVLCIVLFWVGTLAVVVRRDVWPRLFASGPPPVSVEVGDEASQLLPTPWTIYRGTTRVGRLETRTTYVDADNTFQFTHEYSGLEMEVAGVNLRVPRLSTSTRVTRAGTLREQHMSGKLEADLRGIKIEAEMTVNGRVENGLFVGTCEIKSPLFNLNRPLDPVPVPNGHAVSPLQVVNRVTGIRAGQDWVVHEVNPLSEAVGMLLREQIGKTGFTIPERKRDPLIARVSSATQGLTWKGEDVPCWVIEYRDAEVKARTWVRASDGKVLKQEAFEKGEQLTVLRDE